MSCTTNRLCDLSTAGEVMIVDAITVSRGLLRAAHEFLEGTVADVPADRVHWTPPGAGSSIAANYVHVLATEDMTVQGLLKGGQPLAATSEKTAMPATAIIAVVNPSCPGGIKNRTLNTAMPPSEAMISALCLAILWPAQIHRGAPATAVTR